MSSRWVWGFGSPALILAGLLAGSGSAFAAGGHGGGGGGHGGGGHSGGFSGGHSGSFGGHSGNFGGHPGSWSGQSGNWNGHGGSWNRGGYGYHRYYPGFYGFGIGIGYYPWYYDSYAPYGAGDYGYAAAYPPYGGDGGASLQTGAPPDDGGYPPPPQPPPVPENGVLIGVRVPPEAELWFEGQKTSQTGPFREFASPSLTPGEEFVYEVRARWNENGQQVERTRKVRVHAGDRMLVNFLPAARPAGPRK